ncbi:MAG: hypothetical protein HY855_14670 [Burkholderiales bacterium]|nr:hypothetical protein [Burkholderiales bacterium]
MSWPLRAAWCRPVWLNGWRAALALAWGLAGCAGAPPGEPPATADPQRPQLSAAQAARYQRQLVLGWAGEAGALQPDPWDPLADPVITGSAPPALHYRVEPAAADGRRVFATVQAAVNQAHTDLAAGALSVPRVYIGITPGRYDELVYVPAGATPITLWGLGHAPEAVRIQASVDARMPGDEFAARFGAVYEAAGLHPDIRALFRGCRQNAQLGTGCTAVMWVRRDGFQLRNLSVANSYALGRGGAPLQPAGQHQAVALKTEGADRVHLEQVQLLGHQDTLYLGSSAPRRVARSFIHRSLVAGDVDFIFGPGTAYFLASEIRWVGALRGLTQGYVAAPSTPLVVPYGFVFEDCDFTRGLPPGAPPLAMAPAGTPPAARVFLARQWFAGATCSPYGEQAAQCAIVPLEAPANPVPQAPAAQVRQGSVEAVGKMVVLRSRLDAGLHLAAPWSPWQTDRRSRAYRPVQFDSDDFWRLLQAAGHDPARWGHRRPVPAEPFLAEHGNTVVARRGPAGP